MSPNLSEAAQRVEWILKKVWNGSQTRMAAEIGVSQSAISNVVTGRQQPGRKFLSAVASNSLINSTWLITGHGDPLITQVTEPGRRALYIARSLFEGLPEEHGDCLGSMQEVPIRLYRPSRYWFEIPVASPLINVSTLKIAAGDFVLFEPDPRGWPENLVGRPCIVRSELGKLQLDHVINQCENKITTSWNRPEQPDKSPDGRNYRPIFFRDEKEPPVPPPQEPRNALIAVGLFRMGGFAMP